MTEYIDRRKLNNNCYQIFAETVRAGKDMTAEEVKKLLLRFEKAIQTAPTAQVVSRGVFEQVRWERDIAMKQLEEYGINFGSKLTPWDITPWDKERSESNG